MKRKTRDWMATVGGIAVGVLAVFFAITDGQAQSILIGLVVLVIGLYYSYNNYTIIDSDNNLLDLPTLFGLMRSKIKLDEIESWSKKTKLSYNKNSKSNNKSYTITVYGAFGRKTATYTNYNTRQEVINNLKSAISG